MVSKTKEVASSTFGEKLIKVRKDAGLTKEKVAQFLSIQIKYLERLEAGDINKLPADVYVKGFLRKYAKILSVDAESLVRDYEKDLERAGFQPTKKPKSFPKLRHRWITITPRTIVFLLSLLISSLAIGYLIFQIKILISPPKLIINQPNQNISTSDFKILLVGQTMPGARLTINGQETTIDRSGNFKQEINLSRGLNIISVVASNRFDKKSEVIREILVQ